LSGSRFFRSTVTVPQDMKNREPDNREPANPPSKGLPS
jgi:hypothetical protein